METLRTVYSELSLLLEQGGPVLWAILAVGIWLYTVLAQTWWALIPLQKEVEDGICNEGCGIARRDIERHFIVYELDQIAWVQRRIPVIGVMIGVCSLGGLLGTVSGMLATFTNMAEQAQGNAMERIALGISEAMITTQAGLLVAIPASFIFVLLRNRVQTLHSALEESLRKQVIQNYQR